MRRRFLTANRAQSFLLPPSIDDWVEEGHPVRFLHDCVDQFVLSEFISAYSREGGSPYDPKMMLTILLYAWCLGIRSSRKIAAACRERIDFRWAAGNLRPDHCAFARFFQRHGEAIKELFTQVLCLCARAGAIRLGVVSLDGTKVGSNASLSANRTLSRLRAEIERMEAEMRSHDAADDARFGAGVSGDDLPAELRRVHERLERLRSAKERLELDLAAERVLSGESSSGRGPKESVSSPVCGEQGELPFGAGSGAAVEPSVNPAAPSDVSVADGASAASSARSAEAEQPEQPDAKQSENKAEKKSRKKKKKKKDADEARVNVTDPESRIMKARQGFVQGYNAQAVVTRDQFVVSCAVTREANDLHQLEPMLLETRRSLVKAGIKGLPRKLNADAGYWRRDLEIEQLEQDGPKLFIATCNPKNQPKESPRGRIPKSATSEERMRRKLSTRAGRETYKHRSMTVEPVFGQIKECLNARRFLRRGLEKAGQEWSLLCSCLNLRKLFLWLGKKKGGASLCRALAAG